MNYDLITHQVNQFAGVMPISIFDKKSLNKRKGITEIRDLSRLTAVNENHDLQNALKNNPCVFRKRDGEATHLYNAAARFGEDNPFKY